MNNKHINDKKNIASDQYFHWPYNAQRLRDFNLLAPSSWHYIIGTNKKSNLQGSLSLKMWLNFFFIIKLSLRSIFK